MKIVLDGFGGDNAPLEAVKGAVTAVTNNPELEIIITGDETQLKQVLKDINYTGDKISIVHTTQVIGNNEPPVEAIKAKTDSSLVRAFDILKQDDVVGLVSAGSTGAILTGGFLKIGRIAGISRPSLAPLFPTIKGEWVMPIDVGANMDCKPINLVHFAMMGSIYMKNIFGIENPRVGLLNVGTEEHKGNELVKQAHEELKKLKDINYAGSMEARDFLSGNYDVVVADGFAGNVLIKSTEGTMAFSLNLIKKQIKSTALGKMGGLLLKPTFKQLKKKLDYTNYPGSPLLGVKKLVVKTHGSSLDRTFLASIEQIVKMHKAGLIDKLSALQYSGE
ncbi:MAG: phosphate acyltransferase PlsX [Christensenellaceae bacterium]|jgi:glycerol-3-phosphate acyltransferase PlsX|nr:phosphate acyltransferase PlsX [Christensenellaceae bacterium]